MLERLPIYALSRFLIAFVWVYHGMVPKLLGPHRDELAMNLALGLSEAGATRLSFVAGLAEVVFGIGVIVLWRRRWPLIVTAVMMVGLLLFVAVFAPALLAGAFNPVTTNLSVLGLALIALKLHPSSQAGSDVG